jgi:uncharacterized protein (DUF2267 family)
MTMDASDFYALVQARMPDVELEPEQVTREVFAALADRLSPHEAAELGAELPETLGDLLAHAHGDGTLDRDDFIEDLAARLDLDDADAEAVAAAVLGAVREVLEPVVAIDQVLEALPPDLAQLMS